MYPTTSSMNLPFRLSHRNSSNSRFMKDMKKIFLILTALSSFPAWAQLNVPLTLQEALYPGSVAGVARTNEPFCMGVPIADSAHVSGTDLSSLGLTGSTAGQFRVLGTWPDGYAKWVEVCGIVPTLAAGSSATVTLTSNGSGNFGGPSLATDNGSTITVATGAATFTVKKANFNGIDQVVMGSTTVVASGASQGFVVTGPSASNPYPGNATCGTSTPCNVPYSSANDPHSTCSIEKNGPVAAVLKCSFDHVDGSGNVYMHGTARMYFYLNKSSVKVTSILRNADYGTSNTFATAYKGHQGYELRITPNISGPANYAIANDTSSPSTGSVSGTDSVYLYQGESQLMTLAGSWCGYQCVPYTNDKGYSIVKNGSTVLAGADTQYPQGWADITDGNGVGVETGVYQLSAYWPKSLEFNNGGKDVRIGIWARENSQAYYQSWPGWSIHDLFLNFHAAPVSAPANEFLKFQHYLVGRADRTQYNNAGVFPYSLVDPTQENNFYNSMLSGGQPSVTQYYNFNFQDRGLVNTYTNPLSIYRFYGWGNGGGGNQMEFHWSDLLNFLRRGMSGRYLEAAHFYRMVAEGSFPHSDGFNWRDRPASETDAWGFPTAVSDNSTLSFRNWVDQEHAHWYGMGDYYFMTGDETIKDALLDGPKDRYLNQNAALNLGHLWNSRAIGGELMATARYSQFLQSVGDSDSAAMLTQGVQTYGLQVKPQMCISGYPAGCSAGTADNPGPGTTGVSRTRGVPYGWQGGGPSCASGGVDGRLNAAFQSSILLEGIWELRQTAGPTWADYNNSLDLAYGISKWALTEMYVDDGTGGWVNNGFRYYEALDYPNNCGDEAFSVRPNQTVWFPFFIQHVYTGATDWQQKFNMALQKDAAATATDEFGHFTIAAVINEINNSTVPVLVNVPVTVTPNANGSYTLSWTVPQNAQSYRIKTGPQQIVDWIGFDPTSNTFTGDPAHTMAWFAATDVANVPAPAAAGSTQQFTVTGLPASQFFAVKAYVGGGSAPVAPPVAPPACPVISSVSASSITSSGVMVSWTTDEASNSQVAYGGTSAYGSLSGLTSTATTAHSVALSGLTASTTYHYQVISQDSQGNLTRSGDYTFTTANVTAPSAGGTSLPVNSWTMIATHGMPVQKVGWEKLVYARAMKKSIMLGNYHEISSEPNRGLSAYDFTNNRWDLVDVGDSFHTENMPEAGHPGGAFAWDPNDNVILSYCCASGSNQPENVNHTWWFDPVGQVGRDKFTAPKPGIPLEASAAFDSADNKLILHGSGFGTWSYDPTGNAWTQLQTNNIVQGTQTFNAGFDAIAEQSMTYDSANNKVYLFGGRLGYGTGEVFLNDIYSYDVATNTWTLLNPAGAKPAPRQMAGFAYDSTNNVILLFGGYTDSSLSNPAFSDTWIYDPVANSWTQLNPAQSPPPAAPFESLTYDSDDNAFVMAIPGTSGYADGTWAGYPMQTWLFRYNGSGPNPGAGQAVIPSSPGSINRNATGWAEEPILATSGSNLYAGWVETGTPFDATETAWSHVMVNQQSAGGAWTPLGSSQLAINSDFSGNIESFSPALTFSGQQLWVAYYQSNNAGQMAQIYAKNWNGTSWQGGPIGVTASPGFQGASQLIDVSGTPYIAYLEIDKSAYPQKTFARVKYWNGTQWVVQGSGALNRSSATTVAGSVSITSDGTNPYVAWTEYTTLDGASENQTNPQVYVAHWTGSQWVPVGGSLNINPGSGWAFDASVAFVAGQPYVAWTERTMTGTSQLYVKTYNGTNWVTVGSGTLNKNSNTGWAFHPSLAADSVNGALYLGWIEQQAIGQHAQAYVSKLAGSTWTALGSSLNTNPTSGSAQRIGLAVLAGNPVASWGEVSFGSTRQVFVKQWNGSAWTGAGRTATAQPTCDLNADGVVNAVDVQIAINQALGITACGTADLQQSGSCSIVDVQRVITAALGGACVTGN